MAIQFSPMFYCRDRNLDRENFSNQLILLRCGSFEGTFNFLYKFSLNHTVGTRHSVEGLSKYLDVPVYVLDCLLEFWQGNDQKGNDKLLRSIDAELKKSDKF